ncbi:bacteriocin immunity protein [Thermomonospora amylolytica]|uniref:bacteriocin immunity protein n=1 Tax=Thermomonospora amylolytica TaxID=1411117 RepID=UPI000E6C7987|nr:bacteriocin immunity protein [Thermomonospora amylolytica]
MELREELRPQLVAEERLEFLARWIEAIADLLDRGSELEIESEIQRFNEDVGHSYEADDFRFYAAGRSSRDFALEAARPKPRRIPDITREELVEIVARIQSSGPEAEYYVKLFEVNVPHPRASGLIYWPPKELEGATPEEIVDAALSYRPIELWGP